VKTLNKEGDSSTSAQSFFISVTRKLKKIFIGPQIRLLNQEWNVWKNDDLLRKRSL